MSDLVPVRFLRHHLSYNATEIAAFDPAKAQSLVDAGVAEEVVAESGRKTRAKAPPVVEADAPEAETETAEAAETDAPAVETKPAPTAKKPGDDAETKSV